MGTLRTLTLALAGLLFGACASTPASLEPELPEGAAQPPFTAAQIRDATKTGRRYLFEVTGENGQLSRRQIVFAEVEAARTRMVTEVQTADGKRLGDPLEHWVAWGELVGHAIYPVETTTIETESITVPAGTYEALKYTVNINVEGMTQRTRAWFAKNLPGAPVRHEVKLGTKVVSKMVLLEHAEGH